MKTYKGIKIDERLPDKRDWYFILDKNGEREVGYWDNIAWHVWGWDAKDIEYWFEETDITKEDKKD